MGGPPLVELIALYENAERGSPVHQLYNRPNSLVTMVLKPRCGSCESRRGFPATRGCAHCVQPIRRHASTQHRYRTWMCGRRPQRWLASHPRHKGFTAAAMVDICVLRLLDSRFRA